MGIRIRTRLLASVLGLACAGASAMGTLNPAFTLKSILPPALADAGGIGGVDLLPNGDGVICVWGGNQKSLGEVWILPALASGSPGTPVRVAQSLREPLGVKVVGQDFYVMEKPRLLKFTGSGTTWAKSTLWTMPNAWYNDGQWHYFSWGLVHKDDALWFTTGMAFNPDDNDHRERGALMKIPMDGSGYTQYARGMRNTDGIGLGPDDEIFITDNQGDWKPANMMYHVPTPKAAPAKQGRFYGYRTSKNNDCGLTPDNIAQDNCPADPVYPPAVWLPYGGYSNSPTRPVLLKDGAYAGQMIFGDVFHGNILRAFVEKVNGEWQGAAFTFMTQVKGGGGIQFGVQQFQPTPTGSLLVAGIGGGTCDLGGSNNWNWGSTCRGLDLLTPTGNAPFDILAIRSVKDGFDIEFTQPAAAAAGLAANWTIRTTVFTPVHRYGGDLSSDDNNIAVPVSSASLSGDGKHVLLKPATLLTKRMYAITANNTIKSASGADLWTNVGYYTLNAVNTVSAIRGRPVVAFEERLRGSVHKGGIALDLPFRDSWKLQVLRLDGTRAMEVSGKGPGRFESGALPPGLYVVAGRAQGEPFSGRVQVR